jgi:tetratricopeptide (TPR) repeat protein
MSAAGGGHGSRARWLSAASIAAAVVLGGLLWWWSRLPEGLQSFTVPRDAPTATVAFDDFVGAEACAECHQERYASWAESAHGRAGGAPSPEVVIAPFDGRPIEFRDATVVPRVDSTGSYQFVVRQIGHPEQVYSVDGVIGGGHMVGGGTQGFVTRFVDGTERFLAWDWSRSEGRWFCNTGTRLDQGWLAITPDMALADCGDWPPVRVLGTVPRFGNCQGCHGSQILTTQEAGESYQTRYTSLRINCESCHGPGRRHIEAARTGGALVDPDLGIGSFATVDKDGSLEACFECHALKDKVREAHLPGEPLADYYALKFPLLGEDAFFGDFRVRTFAYQEAHLSSACYLDGSMTCVSCHEPHGQAYQDEFGAPLVGRFDDGQCTSCHASKAGDPQSHTFHDPNSPGSRCVACHMPYLQEPDVGALGVRYARSDHAIPLPRPRFDRGLGVETACGQCHQDQPAEALEDQAEAWWGTLKPHRPLVQALSDTLAGWSDEQAAHALLRPSQHDPIVQFAALARFLTDHLPPDQPSLDPETRRRLQELAVSPDLEVRSLALASLHWAHGDDPETRGFLTSALERETVDEDRVRQRWVLALSFLGDEARLAGETERALVAFEKALELLPEDGRLLGAMGAALNQSGAYDRAIPLLQRSAAADRSNALTFVNLAIAQAALGDGQAALASYSDAARANPTEPLIFFNLGNMYLRQGSLAEAAVAYERAVVLDPGLARGHYNLARAYIQLGRYEDALPVARRALEFEPDNPGAAQMLQDLLRAVDGPPPP